MNRGPRSTLVPVLRRLGAAAAIAALMVAGAVAVPSTAQAGSVTYTMSCDDWWTGKTNIINDDYGSTTRYRSTKSTCGSHYAWVDVYYASSGGSGNTGKKQSSGQAQVNIPETVRYYRVGTYKTWHSGCGSGCHTEWTYV